MGGCRWVIDGDWVMIRKMRVTVPCGVVRRDGFDLFACMPGMVLIIKAHVCLSGKRINY